MGANCGLAFISAIFFCQGLVNIDALSVQLAAATAIFFLLMTKSRAATAGTLSAGVHLLHIGALDITRKAWIVLWSLIIVCCLSYLFLVLILCSRYIFHFAWEV